MVIVDAHQHYWNPARGDYSWMPMDNSFLAQTYFPDDLELELEACDVEMTVLVQAAPTVNETEYLLGIADATDSVAGVVGWIDFENEFDRDTLFRLVEIPGFLGVRPMIQDIEGVRWMLERGVDWAFREIVGHGIAFDALGYPKHLRSFLTLFKRHPYMRAVIDHCMKPQIVKHSPESFEYWAKGMSRLARETNAYCKLSGLVTEAAEEFTIDDLRPYVDHVISEFGAERVMWGSDWPVCRQRLEYIEWFEMAQSLTSNLSDTETARVFGGTAIEFYRLTRSPFDQMEDFFPLNS